MVGLKNHILRNGRSLCNVEAGFMKRNIPVHFEDNHREYPICKVCLTAYPFSRPRNKLGQFVSGKLPSIPIKDMVL